MVRQEYGKYIFFVFTGQAIEYFQYALGQRLYPAVYKYGSESRSTTHALHASGPGCSTAPKSLSD